MKVVVAKAYKKAQIETVLKSISKKGTVVYKGRNTVKSIGVAKEQWNIKIFKRPHFVNKIVYRFFRKSKAQRSYEYAQYLLDKGFLTPKPIDFVEERQGFFLLDSFYVSEQLNYDENGSVTRLGNVIKGDESGISTDVNWKGGGNFIYCELARYNEDFIGKIYKAKDTKELLKIWKDMKEKSFINYNINIKKTEENIDEFKQFPTNKQKEILISILNKNQLYINLSEINDSQFKVNKENKELNKKFYN